MGYSTVKNLPLNISQTVFLGLHRSLISQKLYSKSYSQLELRSCMRNSFVAISHKIGIRNSAGPSAETGKLQSNLLHLSYVERCRITKILWWSHFPTSTWLLSQIKACYSQHAAAICIRYLKLGLLTSDHASLLIPVKYFSQIFLLTYVTLLDIHTFCFINSRNIQRMRQFCATSSPLRTLG
jgi:hypothetical protein